MKIKTQFTLPKPTIKRKFEWKPIVRLGRTVPWGYDQDPEDENVLLPNVHQLELLEEGKKALKTNSLRVVANWLTTQTGRKISHEGLKRRLSIERKRTNNAKSYRRFEEQAKKAAQKAKALEEGLGGIRARIPLDDTEE